MDVYVVRLQGRIVGISARLQGAEIIRSEEATRIANSIHGNLAHTNPDWQKEYRAYYQATSVENHEVRDVE